METVSMTRPKFPNFWPRRWRARRTWLWGTECGIWRGCRSFADGQISLCPGKSARSLTVTFRIVSAVSEWPDMNCSGFYTSRMTDLRSKPRVFCLLLGTDFGSNSSRFGLSTEESGARSSRCEIHFDTFASWQNTVPGPPDQRTASLSD